MSSILEHFIVFEGLDGAGTTTQLKLLSSRLSSCLPTREPTSGAVGRLIRSVLRGEESVSPWALAMLYAADRFDHLAFIKSAIERGKSVASDRYFFSSLAYQGVTCSWDDVYGLNREYPYPHYLFYIDTSVEECLKRIEERGEKKELFEKREYLLKVRANYERAFETLPPDTVFVRVDGSLAREEMASLVWDALSSERTSRLHS